VPIARSDARRTLQRQRLSIRRSRRTKNHAGPTPDGPDCAERGGIADPFNGHIDEFRIAHVQRSDGWIETTWNNMTDPGAFAVTAAEEQDGGGDEPPPLAGAGVVVCLMG
jgi:hypothetical protein